ncbi:MAG: aldehyde dehydrogenase EutE [Myxococcales bacterium]|nr:aldehyde dehydrogenase EutE [Myxococcota bacterium]MDW8280413.1 aldehyde dehydrogenase EutE [Myxococcales bacterium]
MQIDERRIQEIVERVVQRLGGQVPRTPMEAVLQAAERPARPLVPPQLRDRDEGRRPGRIPQGKLGLFPDVDSAVQAARKAFEQYENTPLALRERIVAAMRQVTLKHVRELAEYAVAETGYGRVEDKIKKNTLCAEKTPGPEILRPIAFTGDHGLTVIDRAAYGVIGAITPTTNPTETIINNGVGMLSGGNTVVFNTHPYAWRTSAWHVHLLNEAIIAVGGPANLLCMVAEPTIESAQKLMRHPGVRLLVVTGGPAVVKEAMASGKRAIAAGPGNPPAVVDETAHLDVAAQGIVDGASIDNNIICTAEKEILVVSSVADKLLGELERRGCYLLNERQVRALEGVVLEEGGKHINKKWVGKNASVIARQIGVHVSDDCRLLVAQVPEEHPFVQHELLMPVIGLVRYPDVTAAIAGAVRCEHGFGHTAVMYSTNIDALSAMARTINTSIYVKNGPNLAGLGYLGEGYTSFTIASPTGEGLTTALSFTRERRCTLKDAFRFV